MKNLIFVLPDFQPAHLGVIRTMLTDNQLVVNSDDLEIQANRVIILVSLPLLIKCYKARCVCHILLYEAKHL